MNIITADFNILFSAEAGIVKMLSPHISSPHMVKWAAVKPPRHHIWESVFVLLVDVCWNFFHNVLNLSPNRCHLYIWLSAFPDSYILTLLICPRASTEMHFSLAGLMLLGFFVAFVTWHLFLFCFVCFFSPGIILRKAKYLERASSFILFSCIKRMPLTTMLELI